ncbi:SulP family inorganic anion transporter [Marinobacter caseinilyticus]|uniref:SulP family inorganic anion transporter n=1 Tax=Marinobacter caseinilyticus TaxID=2692195 RepID=UPI001409F39C|nr:sulfate permease [Marinobacter caseinilyticus]
MARRLRGYFPLIGWLGRYNRRLFASDAVAAIIVTAMVIPQSLAFALLAGLPPQAGLYASILPAIAYTLFGTGNTLAIGPVALISLMSAAAVGEVAQAGSAGYISASITLALLSGVILFAMGLLRLGFLSNFISHPVISGFITASGLLIATSQLQHVLGVRISGDNLMALGLGLWRTITETHGPTLMIGLPALVFLYGVRHYLAAGLSRLSFDGRVTGIVVRAGPLIAVVIATAIVATLSLDQHGVSIVGNVPRGLPAFGVPGGSLALIEQLLLPALLISIVTFVESVSLAHKLAARRNERIRPDQELLGLGAANIASALSGGFAVAGGFSRSIINYDADAKTPAAGAMTGVFIGVITLFFSSVFYYLPNAVLAATIIIAVLTLVDLRAIRETWEYSRHDGAALVATLIITLFLGVTTGILTGVTLSLMLYLWRTSRPHSALVGRIAGTEHFRNIQRYETETSPYVMILRVDESLYFANARYLEDRVYTLIVEQPQLRDFVLMCPAVNYIDASALETLEAINGRLRDSGVRLHLSEVKGPVMDKLEKSRFLNALSGEVFMSTYHAWCKLKDRSRPPQPDDKQQMQTSSTPGQNV